MMSRRLQCLRTVVMALACIALAGSPAWAQSTTNCNYNCCCLGLDIHGCLCTPGCCNVTSCCVCNVKTCCYTCACKCCVKNCCKKSQCFKNCWFLQKCSYSCAASCYNCDQYGDCEYSCNGNCPA
jgi:hypothetical protein